MRSFHVCLLSGLMLASAAALHAQSSVPQSPALPARAPALPGIRQMRDIPYVAGGHERQKLDLYLPVASGSACPLVIWVHGGGWNSGSKNGSPAIRLVERGYAVASIDYRLSQDAIYPAQIEDCKSAVRFLRAHAVEYGIQPKRIGVWGGSAGGHLVSLLGATGDIRDFDAGANLDQSSQVQCVVDWFGPTDFLHYGDPPSQASYDPNSAGAKLLGGKDPEKARRASPLYFVNKDAAPFLIMQGDKDNLVPLQQSQVLDAALKKNGVECNLMIFPGAGHGGPVFTSPTSMAAICEFLDRHLKTR